MSIQRSRKPLATKRPELSRRRSSAQRPADRSLDSVRLIAAQLQPVDDELSHFYGRLSATVAKLAGAGRVGFFLLENETLLLQEEAFGIASDLARTLPAIECRADGGSAATRVVHQGEIVRADLSSDDQGMALNRHSLAPVGAKNVVAVPWSSGATRLGLVAAYDSSAPGGFTEDDVWVLQVSATTAALVWQQRELAKRLVAGKDEEGERMRGVAERMGELEEMKRKILNLAAHELRGPLTVIRGYLSMLADGSLDAASLRRVLPILVGKAAQMDALVTQMLEVARLEEGRLHLETAVVDLGAVVRDTIDVAALLAVPGVTVFFERRPEPVLVVGDAQRIATIAGNLIDNAMKYSPDGGLVHCELGSEGGKGFLAIRDEGLGIASHDLPSLFTRFGRIVTADNSHIAGTGLGLHLSHELARMQGGDITVESELGRGSVFTLWLPLAEGKSMAGSRS